MLREDEKEWLVCQALSVGPLRFKQIVDSVGINISALFYTTKKMIRTGLVTKIFDDEGRVRYQLTEEGLKMVHAPYPSRKTMKCLKCGYVWVTKLRDKKPRICPKCKSTHIVEVSEK